MAGKLCAFCDSGFHLRMDGSCVPCPASEYNVLPPISFAAFVLAFFGLVALAIIRVENGSVTPSTVLWFQVVDALKQSREVCAYLILSAQFVATTSNDYVVGLPYWITSVYGWIGFFNLDVSSVRYEGCFSGYVFTAPLVLMVGTFLMLCFQLLRFPRLASIQAQIFLVLSVIYPSITRSALRFVHSVCRRTMALLSLKALLRKSTSLRVMASMSSKRKSH